MAAFQISDKTFQMLHQLSPDTLKFHCDFPILDLCLPMMLYFLVLQKQKQKMP